MEILIVGGGYIGMYTARRLERLLRRGEATVTVVDPRGYMTYQPFLAEAAGGSVEPRHVIAPLPRVLRHSRVLTGKIVSMDRSQTAVWRCSRQRTARSRCCAYDVLVMAAGSVSRVLPVEGLAEHGAGFKTVSEAVHLRNHVLGRSPWQRRPTILPSARPRSRSSSSAAGSPGSRRWPRTKGSLTRRCDSTRRWTRLSCAGCWSRRPAGSSPSWMSGSASGRCARCGGAASTCGCTPGLPRPRTARCCWTTAAEMAAGTLVWAAGVRPSPLGAAAGCRPTRPADSGWRGPGHHRGTGRVRRRGHRGGAGPDSAR